MNGLLEVMVCLQKICALSGETGTAAGLTTPLPLHHTIPQAPFQAIDHIPRLGMGYAGTGTGDPHIIGIVDEVQQQFQAGREKRLLLFQSHVECRVENGKIVNSYVEETNGSGHGALAGMLKELGVDVLICGGIGMGKGSGIFTYRCGL